jgi:cytochrome c oxidase subunit 3
VSAPAVGAPAAAGEERFLAHHFRGMREQLETSTLGIWLFLGSEVLFFGGLFAAYAVARALHPELFRYGRHLLDWRLGALNTAVLVTSSLSVAWAVRAAQLGDRRGLVTSLSVTLGLALTFLGVKAVEWTHKLEHGVRWGAAYRPAADLLAGTPGLGAAPDHPGAFFSLYYLMTGLHGLHVLAGVGLLAWLVARARRGDFGPGYFVPIEVVALYWHLVDAIWIFLFPLFYLA